MGTLRYGNGESTWTGNAGVSDPIPPTLCPSLFGSKDFNATNKNIRFKSFRYLYFVTQLDFMATAKTSISSMLSGVVTGQVINLPVQGQQICS